MERGGPGEERGGPGEPAAEVRLGRVLARAQGGDGEAFAALVRHYDAGLRALAFHLLGDRELMDDALQETYLKAFRALPGFRGESALGTWLYRITYNVSQWDERLAAIKRLAESSQRSRGLTRSSRNRH